MPISIPGLVVGCVLWLGLTPPAANGLTVEQACDWMSRATGHDVRTDSVSVRRLGGESQVVEFVHTTADGVPINHTMVVPSGLSFSWHHWGSGVDPGQLEHPDAEPPGDPERLIAEAERCARLSLPDETVDRMTWEVWDVTGSGGSSLIRGSVLVGDPPRHGLAPYCVVEIPHYSGKATGYDQVHRVPGADDVELLAPIVPVDEALALALEEAKERTESGAVKSRRDPELWQRPPPAAGATSRDECRFYWNVELERTGRELPEELRGQRLTYQVDAMTGEVAFVDAGAGGSPMTLPHLTRATEIGASSSAGPDASTPDAAVPMDRLSTLVATTAGVSLLAGCALLYVRRRRR